jgi:dTDP-4-dehydrorhamnose reductase
MLGHKVVQVLGNEHDVWAAVRGQSAPVNGLGPFGQSRILRGVDAVDPDSVVRAIATTRADVVVNGIGIVKQVPEAMDPLVSIGVNSLFPHRLADLCDAAGARLVHISTDCVFSGARGMYREDDPPDPADLYGRSKLLGEVVRPGHVTLRTSIIGRELRSANGLVEWFLGNAGGTVSGYRRAIYSGLTTLELARVIRRVVEHGQSLEGLYHVSAEPISKYELLLLLRDAFGVSIAIEPDDVVHVDRSMDSTRFRRETGYDPPEWKRLVFDMALDADPYLNWRNAG